MSGKSALALAREAVELAEKATPSPWVWVRHGTPDHPQLVGMTPGRGWNLVMDFVRKGMSSATLRLNRNGLMFKPTVDECREHPDSALIAHAGTSYATVARAAIEAIEMLRVLEPMCHPQRCSIHSMLQKRCDCGMQDIRARIDALTKEGEHD